MLNAPSTLEAGSCDFARFVVSSQSIAIDIENSRFAALSSKGPVHERGSVFVYSLFYLM